jgi:hypothetical protein
MLTGNVLLFLSFIALSYLSSVTVTQVTLTHLLNSTAVPLLLRHGTHIVLTCWTNCAYPAPKITWTQNGVCIKWKISYYTEIGEARPTP